MSKHSGLRSPQLYASSSSRGNVHLPKGGAPIGWLAGDGASGLPVGCVAGTVLNLLVQAEKLIPNERVIRLPNRMAVSG